MTVTLTVVVLGCLAVTALLLRTPRLRPGAGPGTAPVSVVVPARDEATNLPALLDSLAAGSVRPAEVIVVDDDSSDATAAVAAARGARVVRPGTPPPGWLGKPWACSAGAQAASGGRLVFLDADVRLAPGGLAAVLAAHDAAGGLVSVQPRHRPGSPLEELSAMFNVCAVAGAGGGPVGRARVAFGPCIVVDRDVYARLGGHGAVAGSVIEDIDLARRAQAAGVATSTWRGGDLVAFRMYPGGPRALLDGWTKNIALGAAAAPRWAVAGTVLWVAGLAAAAVSAGSGLIGWATGSGVPWWPLATYALAAAHAWWAFARVGRFRMATALAFPAPVAFFIAVFARAQLLMIARRPVRWRDRRVLHEGS